MRSCWWRGLGRWCVTTLLTLRSLALTPLLSRRLARWVRARDYDNERFFAADGAAEPWVARRKEALRQLAATFKTRYAESAAWGDAVRESFSDLRFTDANRVPVPVCAPDAQYLQSLRRGDRIVRPPSA